MSAADDKRAGDDEKTLIARAREVLRAYLQEKLRVIESLENDQRLKDAKDADLELLVQTIKGQIQALIHALQSRSLEDAERLRGNVDSSIALINHLINLKKEINNPSAEFKAAQEAARTNLQGLHLSPDNHKEALMVIAKGPDALKDLYTNTKTLTRELLTEKGLFSNDSTSALPEVSRTTELAANLAKKPTAEISSQLVDQATKVSVNPTITRWPQYIGAVSTVAGFGGMATMAGFMIAGAGIALVSALTFGGALALIAGCLALVLIGRTLLKGEASYLDNKSVKGIKDAATKIQNAQRKPEAGAAKTSERKDDLRQPLLPAGKERKSP